MLRLFKIEGGLIREIKCAPEEKRGYHSEPPAGAVQQAL